MICLVYEKKKTLLLIVFIQIIEKNVFSVIGEANPSLLGQQDLPPPFAIMVVDGAVFSQWVSQAY